MDVFTANEYPTIGVEQEFHLIDPDSADLMPAYEQVADCLPEELKAVTCHELFYSVLEMRTGVHKSPATLEDDVRKLRTGLAEACEAAGVRCAASGSHPFAKWREQQFVESEHYNWVAEQCVSLAHRLLAFGLHIHVGMKTAESALYAQNEFRRWMYPVSAFCVNSPFFEGESTGLASMRLHLFEAMPRTGIAPEVWTMEELEQHFQTLIKAGDVTSPGDLWWSTRIQPPFGTIELRICDLPTDSRRVAAVTAVVQAAMASYQDIFEQGGPRTVFDMDYLHENHWKAMRYGLDTDIVDPVSGEVVSMREQLSRLIKFIRPKAVELGSEKYIDLAESMISGETEAARQIRRFEELNGDLVALELDVSTRTVE